MFLMLLSPYANSAACLQNNVRNYKDAILTETEATLKWKPYRVGRIVLQELYYVFFRQVITFELLIAPFPCWLRHFERRAGEL